MTVEEVNTAVKKWKESDKTMRLGQFIVNALNLKERPDLFYETDDARAYRTAVLNCGG